MHGGADRVRRNKNVARQASFEVRRGRRQFGNDEPKSVAVQAQFARNQVLSRGSLRDGVAVGIRSYELPRRDEFLESIIEFPSLLAMQPQLAHQLLVAGGLPRLALDLLQDGGVREHGTAA